MKFVYMLRAGDSHYKVGVASNVLNRVKGIQTSNQHRIEVIIAKPVLEFEAAEKMLHRLVSQHKTDGGTEWFNLNSQQALELVVKIANLELEADLVDHLAVRNITLKQALLEKRIASVEAKLAPPTPKEIPKEDELYEQAIKVVAATGKASASMLQRRLSVGYARAARLLDKLEQEGIVGPQRGAMPRALINN